MKNLSIYDFEEITLDELKNQYPYTDEEARWQVDIEEDLHIQLEITDSLALISKSRETLNDPRFIFGLPFYDEENEIEQDQTLIDLHAKIESKHYQRIQVRADYIKFLNDRAQEIRQPAPDLKPKQNKSLLLDGKGLNLSERFKIANMVLGIDTKIRTLNIPDLEKYKLLAYILGCDKDNARNIMNGSYDSKDRDLTPYFSDLGLNK